MGKHETTMTKSSIEITDTQYLIRLNRDEFGYAKLKSFMAHFLSEQAAPFCGESWNEDPGTQRYAEHGDRFDHLADK